jgi:myo-inositol-1(or 4)-monophosphatase
VAGSDDLLSLAVGAATVAAQLLLEGRRRALATVATKSTATDMVSEMDHAAEALIRDHLLGARPEDGFLGEETGETHGTSGLRWVVDPLDGTTNYLYGHPGWNVSIAAEDEDGSLVGVVADPVLAIALCATGFGYDPERRGRQATVLAAVLPHVRDVRRMGAAAVDLCSVACGRIDAYWERGLGPWDLAAGSLIAREAGAEVDDGTETGFVLAAPAGLFDAFRELLITSGAGVA